MKKMTSILIAGMMILALAACGQSAAPAGSGTPSSAPASQSPAAPESSGPAEPPAGSSAPEQTPFETYDFSGKTLIPFVTHGGSGFSGTVRTIQGLEPGAAVVEDGLSVSRNNVPQAQENVKAWVDSLRARGKL